MRDRHREWILFHAVFAPDVVAEYPNRTYDGIGDWLRDFVPFHDACTWTQHFMSTHVAGVDRNGAWASCYGLVQWIHSDRPETVNTANTIHRATGCASTTGGG